MHYLIAPDFVDRVVSLNNTAKTIRHAFLDFKPLLLRCVEAEMEDAHHLAGRWSEYCEEYQRILNASETAAIKVAAMIRSYLALQTKTTRAGTTEDKIRDMCKFNEKLSLLSLDQSGDFDRLGENLTVFERELEEAILSHATAIQSTHDSMQQAAIEMDEELARNSSRSILPWDRVQNMIKMGERVWNKIPSSVRNAAESWIPDSLLFYINRIAMPNNELAVVRGRPSEAKTTAEELKCIQREAIDALHGINADLKTQSELLQAVFTEITTKLDEQSNDYLKALRDVHPEPSPAEQDALRKAGHRFLSTSAAWKERENTLLDEYAKMMK